MSLHPARSFSWKKSTKDSYVTCTWFENGPTPPRVAVAHTRNHVSVAVVPVVVVPASMDVKNTKWASSAGEASTVKPSNVSPGGTAGTLQLSPNTPSLPKKAPPKTGASGGPAPPSGPPSSGGKSTGGGGRGLLGGV